jgi:hypothetical protein
MVEQIPPHKAQPGAVEYEEEEKKTTNSAVCILEI